MLKLYSLEFCPYCEVVIKKLNELGLAYEKIEVPAARPQRKEVFQVSGQNTVPVLQDGDVVLSDEEEIVGYLDRTYNSLKKGD
jgi:glutathione S-transferase